MRRMAEEAGGRLLLRIEDTDETRARPEFVTAIFEDLAWLGLRWEEPVRIQSEHFGDYEDNLRQAVVHGRGLPLFLFAQAGAGAGAADARS